MKMDPTTESIAHFIGLFHVSAEELRLRQDYVQFTLKRAAQEELPPIDPAGVRLQAPHELGRYDPGLDYEPKAPALPPVDPARMGVDGGLDLSAPRALDPDGPEKASHDHVSVFLGLAHFGFPLETPGSLVTVTMQVVTLSDNDLFLNGPGAHFTDPAVLQATLDDLAALAESLAGFEVPDLPQDTDWSGFAEGLLAQIDAATPTGTAAHVSTFRGSEAEGVIVDGVVMEQAPVWTDLLPLYLQRDIAEDEPEEGGAQVSGKHDFALDFGDDAPNPYALEPGHQIVAGANQAINEIALGSQWLDAPVIVVRGDVAKFDAVSQVNVLVEHDRIDGVAAGQQSLAHNVADITTESSEDPDAPPLADVLPKDWQVVRVEADLLQVNWVKQFTYITDFDRAEVTFSGQATFLGLGENEVINAAILNEFGYHYDLIFVAGDMMDGTVVSQKNVLFDSDVVTTQPGGPGPTMAATQPAASAPTQARASDALHDATIPGAQDVPTHGIGAAAADGDTSGPDGEGPPPAVDAAPALSVADNLLFNQATLKTTGVDTFVEMTESFAETAERLAEGAEAFAREVAEDALFAGKEALRVLQIDGDLIKLNLFEQTNIVGDADQVHLDMQALRDRLEAEMELISGSNALVNLATVAEHGLDSRIMAGGAVYDDALIHQAELFDVDALPNGVAISALANEAVAAFLRDDMHKAMETPDAIAPTGDFDASPHLDVMQTTLA